MPNDLMELAERCEKASGPDRELDAAIVTTLCPGATVSEYIAGGGDDIVFHAEALGIRNKDCCPWYTHSLDAAMTLVPGKDWEWSLEWESGSLLYHPDIEQYACAKIGDPVLRMEAECVTPALALCAAALRARARAAS